MRRCTFQGREYVISRERGGKVELVDVETGELKIVDSAQRGEFSNQRFHQIGVDRRTIPFLERPRDFLSTLRQKRLDHLRTHQAASRKPKEKKLHKGPRAVKVKPPRIKDEMALLAAKFARK